MYSNISKQIRLEAFNLSKANGGYHYGRSFSCAEILISLYTEILEKEDVFILSKGHGCWCYYAFLTRQGYSPALEGHPHRDIYNGVYWTTGSEGHGFPVGIGVAFSKKFLEKRGKVYILMGDGECQEGTTWESLLLAGFYKLKNLTVIIDFNGIQGSGFVKNILPVNAINETAKASNWNVFSIDGHDVKTITKTLKTESDNPKLIIANTIKGKGVSFMENDPKWHAKWPNKEEELLILKELC